MLTEFGTFGILATCIVFYGIFLWDNKLNRFSFWIRGPFVEFITSKVLQILGRSNTEILCFAWRIRKIIRSLTQQRKNINAAIHCET